LIVVVYVPRCQELRSTMPRAFRTSGLGTKLVSSLREPGRVAFANSGATASVPAAATSKVFRELLSLLTGFFNRCRGYEKDE